VAQRLLHPFPLDAKDLGILRLMGVQPFVDWPRPLDHLKASFFAKRLGISLDTAKARVRRMEESGLIAGYEIYPNFALLGYTAVGFLFRLQQPTAPKTMRDLQSVDGIGNVERFIGSAMCMDIYDRSPAGLDRRVQLVQRLLGATENIRYANYPTIPVPRKLTRLDWRIVLALRGRANRSLAEVAEDLGVSHRTVTRHFERMWEEGSIDTVVRLNTGRAPSVLFTNFLIRFKEAPAPGATKRIHAALDSQWAYCWTPPDRQFANLALGLICHSPSDVQATLDRLHGMPDVAQAEALVSAEMLGNEAWLNEALQRAADEAGPEPPASPMSTSAPPTRVS
jgi:DNA-binding Lrp family transcriptional regulator